MLAVIYSGLGKDVRHDTPQGNRTFVMPDPPLSAPGVTRAAAKAVFPAKAGIHCGYWAPACAGATRFTMA